MSQSNGFLDNVMNAQAIKGILAVPFFRLAGYRPQRVTAETWDRQYRTGYWDHLDGIDNLGGQLSVFGYCQYLSPNAILDVGCGVGLLAKKLKVLQYRQYLGIDISSEAIVRANKLAADARTSFVICDAHNFATDARFDVIVFNQSLYYMTDPVGMIRRYAKLLAPSGRMIIAAYDAPRPRAAWLLIADHIEVEDSMTVIQRSGRTTTKLLRPR